MKNKKTFLTALIVILYFSIIATVTNGFGEGDSDMVLVKYGAEDTIDSGEREPAIPGYPLLLLISVICVITIIYLKKKWK